MREPLDSELCLKILETHLVDHCNLKCKGCGHFSPISETSFAQPAVLLREFRRLAELFRTISAIHLLGGEPLLHPDVLTIMEDVRSCFPCSRITLVTNGTLLPKQPSEFWDCCRKCGIVIRVTEYPIRLNLDSALAAAKRMGVEVEVRGPIITFVRFLNPQGDSDPDTAFRNCLGMGKVPFLKDGKIFSCVLSANIGILNRRFDLQFPQSSADSISLCSVASGLDIIDFLDRPVPFCHWCLEKWPTSKWGLSAMRREEWLGY
jgi:hypothetical protein